MEDNKENIEPLPGKTILLINVCLVLISALFIGSVASIIRYKKQKTEQQKVLLLQQQKAVENLKTTFPDYKKSEDYKRKKEMAIPKISLDKVLEGGAVLHTTIEDARSDDLYNAPVQIGDSYCEKITQVEVYGILNWSIYKNEFGEVGSSSDPRGWAVTPQDLTGTYSTTCMAGQAGYDDPPMDMVALLIGNITCDVRIPNTAATGTYSIDVFYDMQWNEFSVHTTIKITPPHHKKG